VQTDTEMVSIPHEERKEDVVLLSEEAKQEVLQSFCCYVFKILATDKCCTLASSSFQCAHAQVPHSGASSWRFGDRWVTSYLVLLDSVAIGVWTSAFPFGDIRG
jgi:hypothetical protein